MITESVIALLLANSDITAMVGNRIRPNIIKPDSEFSAVYVSSYRMQKMPCDDSSAVYSGTIEIGIYANKYEQCSDIMDLIRSVLDDYSGFVGNVGISILQGEETTDDYDETRSGNVKVIEYEAYAQIRP